MEESCVCPKDLLPCVVSRQRVSDLGVGGVRKKALGEDLPSSLGS